MLKFFILLLSLNLTCHSLAGEFLPFEFVDWNNTSFYYKSDETTDPVYIVVHKYVEIADSDKASVVECINIQFQEVNKALDDLEVAQLEHLFRNNEYSDLFVMIDALIKQEPIFALKINLEFKKMAPYYNEKFIDSLEVFLSYSSEACDVTAAEDIYELMISLL